MKQKKNLKYIRIANDNKIGYICRLGVELIYASKILSPRRIYVVCLCRNLVKLYHFSVVALKTTFKLLQYQI